MPLVVASESGGTRWWLASVVERRNVSQGSKDKTSWEWAVRPLLFVWRSFYTLCGSRRFIVGKSCKTRRAIEGASVVPLTAQMRGSEELAFY